MPQRRAQSFSSEKCLHSRRQLCTYCTQVDTVTKHGCFGTCPAPLRRVWGSNCRWPPPTFKLVFRLHKQQLLSAHFHLVMLFFQNVKDVAANCIFIKDVMTFTHSSSVCTFVSLFDTRCHLLSFISILSVFHQSSCSIRRSCYVSSSSWRSTWRVPAPAAVSRLQRVQACCPSW